MALRVRVFALVFVMSAHMCACSVSALVPHHHEHIQTLSFVYVREYWGPWGSCASRAGGSGARRAHHHHDGLAFAFDDGLEGARVQFLGGPQQFRHHLTGFFFMNMKTIADIGSSKRNLTAMAWLVRGALRVCDYDKWVRCLADRAESDFTGRFALPSFSAFEWNYRELRDETLRGPSPRNCNHLCVVYGTNI